MSAQDPFNLPGPLPPRTSHALGLPLEPPESNLAPEGRTPPASSDMDPRVTGSSLSFQANHIGGGARRAVCGGPQARGSPSPYAGPSSLGWAPSSLTLGGGRRERNGTFCKKKRSV